MMLYNQIIYLISFFIIINIYFWIAKKYQIIDVPNQRSSHDKITIRGGGIIIWIGCLIYFFTHNLNYPYFIISISILALISFLDDIKNVPKRIRFTLHIASFCLVLFEIYPFHYSPFIYIICVIIGLGFLNGFNFMDGINGITVAYSLVSIISFFFVETQLFHFVDSELLVLVFISLVVFAFYNFRTKAKTFAGDIGSISIAFIFIFFQLLVYQKSNSLLFLFFFLVYGIDVAYTLVIRLLNGENIFQAHRLHLFQLLKNELQINALLVSTSYAIIQLIINILIILLWNEPINIQILGMILIIICLIIIYHKIRIQVTKLITE